jgi:hypothetical protein
METTNKRNTQDEDSRDMDLLLQSGFVQRIKEASQKDTSTIQLGKSFRDFVRSMCTVFGTETGQLPYLYRLASYTIAQLNVLKAEIKHIGPGEKHGYRIY